MEASRAESSLAGEGCAKDEKHSIISTIFILSHFQTLENLFFFGSEDVSADGGLPGSRGTYLVSLQRHSESR